MKISTSSAEQQVEKMDNVKDASRRRFFQLAGGIAGAGILLQACRRTPPSNVYVGSGDIGLLNYLYILEQVEAAFYTQTVATLYNSFTASERLLFIDMRDQEIAHREFLKQILGKSAVSPIVTDFSSVTFADRTSLLTNAAAIEDMVVSAYNGAAQLFSNTDYVLMTAKIVTVEARHAGYVRDILTHNSFADNTVISNTGLDQAVAPTVVMTLADKYIQTRFDITKLPTF